MVHDAGSAYDHQQVKHCHQLPVGVQEDNQWISGKAGKRAGPVSYTHLDVYKRHFDNYMGAWCEEREINYTRYSDDMTFSGLFDEKKLKRKVRNYLLAMGFELNEKKTRLLGRHTRQTVTGIVVNEKPDVGRAYRRKVRAEVYYCKKYGAVEHLRCV